MLEPDVGVRAQHLAPEVVGSSADLMHPHTVPDDRAATGRRAVLMTRIFLLTLRARLTRAIAASTSFPETLRAEVEGDPIR